MYRVTVDEQTQHQIDALPASALNAYLELRVTLQIDPWGGQPLFPDTAPKGVLTRALGPHAEGPVYYLVLEADRRVAVLEVLWLG